MAPFFRVLAGLALAVALLLPSLTRAQQPAPKGQVPLNESKTLPDADANWLDKYPVVPPSSGASSPPAAAPGGNWWDKYPDAPSKTVPDADAKGQFDTGMQFLNGQGVKQDYEEAARRFRLAAEKGFAPAQLQLGLLYDLGRGVPQDYKEAAHWCRLAAEQGDAWAQLFLGLLYVNGQGVPKDYKEAAHWSRLAAEQGDAMGQNNLGSLYENGQGVPKDYKEAARWYRLAAEQGAARAQLNLGRLYGLGRGVLKNDKEAAHWYRLAAEQGNVDAQTSLGVRYFLGQGVRQDYREAAHWSRLAAEQGDARGQVGLGLLYFLGQGVPKDYVSAYQWFNLAASADDKLSAIAASERDRIAALMTPGQIAEGQRLSAQWQPRQSGSPTEQPDSQAATNDAPAQGADKAIFGSGFFIADDGRVLTNAHVVENCASISVASLSAPAPSVASSGDDSLPPWKLNWGNSTPGKAPSSAAGVSNAQLLGRDATNDLALLATSLHPDAVPTWRFTVRQGEEIAIYGFPLAGLLANGGSITTGAVAALTGINQDSRELQITAPVQLGNSGGPVLDRSGNVIGIVVAKLNALNMAQITQDIPQNVNFAIKASVARDFLEAASPLPEARPATAPLATADLAARARQISVRVVCQQ